MNDPSFTDHLARLNRITGSLSQHVTTLTAYSEKLGEVDQRQKTILAEVNEAKKSLEQDAQTKLSATVPVIKDQERVMANIEKRVASARMRLEEQSDTVSCEAYMLGVNFSWQILIFRLRRIERRCHFLLLRLRILSLRPR